MGGKKSHILNQIKRIRLARTELTQAELAQRVGATRQTIISIEAEKYSPSLELAFRLSHVLNEPIEELFQFSGEWV